MGDAWLVPSEGTVVSSLVSEWVKLGSFQVSGAGSFSVARAKPGFV